MIVGMQYNADVLYESDQSESPENEAKYPQNVTLRRVLQGNGREDVERRRANVAIHHPERLVCQNKRLKCRQGLQQHNHQ